MAPSHWPLSSWNGLLRVWLTEIDALAPAERLDVLERPPDRPMAHVDAANVAQVSLAWRACDRLQAGDDPRRAAFPCAPALRLRLARRSASLASRAAISSGVGWRRVGVPASSPISALTASTNEQPLRCISSAMASPPAASAAVPDDCAWARPTNRSSPPQTGQGPIEFAARPLQLRAVAFGDFEDRNRAGLVELVFRKHDRFLPRRKAAALGKLNELRYSRWS